ncbi:UDP-N-acetylmuramate dehydrogenase [Celerinatantimonas sp. YJH-8]|uniref:UDP-N-acetylmuramate dehydrogenase n=1 Tax=Celerinatantimonas sp. YJH-8 TaxID=3228714 RepID=UPI0038BFD219
MKEVTALHTFAVKSYCKDILYIRSEKDLQQLSLYQQQPQSDWIVIGEGSNVLFVEDYQGLLVCNRLLGRQLIEKIDGWYIEAAAGENWHQLVCWLIEHGIGGLENLALIPSSLGAAPVQNIGAYGVEFSQFCQWVDVWDVEQACLRRLTATECQFGYRDSYFKRVTDRWVITRIGLKVSKYWQPQLSYGPLARLAKSPLTPKLLFDEICKLREQKLPDPKKVGNAGSFFKNPVVSAQWVDRQQQIAPEIPVYPLVDGRYKVAAGWLIDQCGLKGYQMEQAAVHDQQALVLTNPQRQASGRQIVSLADHIRQQVWSRYQVELEPEVLLIGAEGLLCPQEVFKSLC